SVKLIIPFFGSDDFMRKRRVGFARELALSCSIIFLYVIFRVEQAVPFLANVTGRSLAFVKLLNPIRQCPVIITAGDEVSALGFKPKDSCWFLASRQNGPSIL